MKSFTPYANSISVGLFIVALLTSAVVLQKKYDDIEHPRIIFTTETRYILPSKIVSNFSFGFKNIIADLYWVKAIQDFSVWDGHDPFYLQEYKNIATLDPKFSYPYLLGILTFTSKSASEKVLNADILETIEPVIEIGIKNLPDNWEIPFYMGTGFQLTKNPEKAFKYLKLAAENKKAPELISRTYKTYLKNTLMGRTASGDLVKAIYDTTESETTKKILESNVMINELTEVLKGIVSSYKTKYGYYPNSIDDLIARNMIRRGPELKSTFTVIINRNNGDVQVTPKVTKGY
jgi:hypothetical protein